MILYPSQTGGGRLYVFGIQAQSYLDKHQTHVSLLATKAGFFSIKPAINNGMSTIPCHTDQSWQDETRRLVSGVHNG